MIIFRIIISTLYNMWILMLSEQILKFINLNINRNAAPYSLTLCRNLIK